MENFTCVKQTVAISNVVLNAKKGIKLNYLNSFMSCLTFSDICCVFVSVYRFIMLQSQRSTSIR